MNKVDTSIKESISVKERLFEQSAEIAELCNKAVKTVRAGGKLILCGNGGSFADAQHICAELIGRFIKDRPSLPAICLGCNSSSTTAIANDYSTEDIFARELSALASPTDLFIPISTSGDSSNILKAIKIAKEKKIPTVGLTGKTGGDMAAECIAIIAPSDNTARIQECHILIGHIMCEALESIN